MTTIKTPLPEKVHPNFFDGYLTDQGDAINQLIDCVAELREVVERQKAQITNLRGGWTDAEIAQAALNPTLNLKEILVKTLRNKSHKPWDYYNDVPGEIEVVNWDDVEAIINRLIP